MLVNTSASSLYPVILISGPKPQGSFTAPLLVTGEGIQYQAIWSLDYWFGCSDGLKLRYLAKNVKISKFLSQMNIFFQKKIKNILKVIFYTF